MSFTADGQHAYAPAPSDPPTEDSPSATASEGTNQPEAGNVDKIREILFGGQMRAYDRRFSRLEERLTKESADLREENRKLFNALETFVKSEFEALSNRLQSEQRTRDEAIQNGSRELHDTAKTLEAKLGQLDSQTINAHRELRQQLLDQSKSLSEEIRRKYEEVSALLDRELAMLDNDKTSRGSLSALFSEVALRLNHDFKMPGDN
jgi:paraquat-inducible protein B